MKGISLVYQCVGTPLRGKGKGHHVFLCRIMGSTGSPYSIYFVSIFGIIETMADFNGCWVETSPPQVSKSWYANFSEKPIIEIKEEKKHYGSQYSLLHACMNIYILQDSKFISSQKMLCMEEEKTIPQMGIAGYMVISAHHTHPPPPPPPPFLLTTYPVQQN